MKKKLKMIERSLGSENYECIHCEVPLNELSRIAVWPDCEHVCYCEECARFIFIGKGILKPVTMDEMKTVSYKHPACS